MGVLEGGEQRHAQRVARRRLRAPLVEHVLHLLRLPDRRLVQHLQPGQDMLCKRM